MQNPSKQHTPLGLVTAADHFRIRHKPALNEPLRYAGDRACLPSREWSAHGVAATT